MEPMSTAGLNAALRLRRARRCAPRRRARTARRWRRCTSAITRRSIATAGRSCATTRRRAMRFRARWPRLWRPCGTRSGTSRLGDGCSGSSTTSRSRGCASAARRSISMRSGRLGSGLPGAGAGGSRAAGVAAGGPARPARAPRVALVLRELSGLSHEEIAGVLNSSARAVKQTIFEARTALHECAEGRTMLCADVQRALSDGDGRVLRGRRCARTCAPPACRRFKAALAQRPADLAVLAPALPARPGPRCWPSPPGGRRPV